ncbi:MAG: SDR family NAD(P)-dependent oxidoreductase [Pseudomonadota bacterium]
MMQLDGSVVLVTGAASGIGRSMVTRAVARGAKAVYASDVNEPELAKTAEMAGGTVITMRCDVSKEADCTAQVERALADHGHIDLLCSNAGVGFSDGPDWMATSQSNDQWAMAWGINVMAHVYFARAALPSMIKRGTGNFIITASAAGLITQTGDAVYSTTKHAAVGFAESLAITHGDDGIGVTLLCPQAVNTNLIKLVEGGAASVDGVLEPDQVVDLTFDGAEQGEFLVTAHDTVLGYWKNKVENYGRWVGGMRKFRRMLIEKTGRPV